MSGERRGQLSSAGSGAVRSEARSTARSAAR